MNDFTAAQMADTLRTFRKHYSPVALYTLMDEAAEFIERQDEGIAALAAERDEWKRSSDKKNEWWRIEEIARKESESELEALRNTIDDAPHAYGNGGYWCMAGLENVPCTCWKSQALGDHAR